MNGPLQAPLGAPYREWRYKQRREGHLRQQRDLGAQRGGTAYHRAGDEEDQKQEGVLIYVLCKTHMTMDTLIISPVAHFI